MKSRSRLPIGLVALTLASIALALLVFWSFRNGGPGAASNIEKAERTGPPLSPAIFAVFVLSLTTTYWVGRQSGSFRSGGAERGQLMIDPSFLRARASLRAAAQTPVWALNSAGFEPETSSGEPETPAENGPPEPEPQSGQAPSPGPGAETARPGPGLPASPPGRARRRLSSTGPLLGVALEPRLVFIGQTSLRVSPHCPVRASMRGLIRAMKQMAHSGRQIDQLVKIMDDFVFQANLLALEAAVEAGRTGQGGRGLIAVADRSRQLAICSAEAARNTADLVFSVQAQIQSGAQTVQSVAENFIRPAAADQPAEAVPGPALEAGEH